MSNIDPPLTELQQREHQALCGDRYAIQCCISAIRRFRVAIETLQLARAADDSVSSEAVRDILDHSARIEDCDD